MSVSISSKHFTARGGTGFHLVPPPSSEVFRVARDPWVAPDWAYATNVVLPKTFGGRFDDPSGRWGIAETERFRVFYCATQRMGAFAETTSHFKVKLPELMQRIRNYVTDSDEDEDLTSYTQGVLEKAYLDKKKIGSTVLHQNLQFIDLEHSETLRTLNGVPRLMQSALRLGLDEIDRRVLVEPEKYLRLSQEIAYWAYHQRDTNDNPVAGVRYLSRVGGEWECWGAFDTHVRGQHTPGLTHSIDPADPDIVEIARRFSLNIEIMPGHYISP